MDDDTGVAETAMAADAEDDLTREAEATGVDPRCVDETAVVPNALPTEAAELAWSHEGAWADISTSSKDVSPFERRSLARWVTAALAVLATATAAVWLGTVLYREKHQAVVKPPVEVPAPTLSPEPVPVPPGAPTVTAFVPLPSAAPPPPKPPARTPEAANVNTQTVAHFRALLAQDGMHENNNDIEGIRSLAQRVCGDAAAGNLGPPTAYVSPVPGNDEPPNWAKHAVDDVLEAFCSQYSR